MSKIKKIVLLILSIIVVVILSLIIGIKISNDKFYSNKKTYKEDYMFKISLLGINKEKSTKESNIKNLQDNQMLLFYNEFIPLEKRGEYLYANLEEFVNKNLLTNVIDYVFTNNNTNGEVIEGCTFDKKTNEIKIPISFYDNVEKGQIPVQMEIESSHTWSEIKSSNYNLNVKNLFVKNINVVSDLNAPNLNFSISDSKKYSLKKENLKIYINNQSKPLDKDKYVYESRTGLVTIDFPVAFVNSVKVDIDTDLLSKIVNIRNVKATGSSSSWKTLGQSMRGYSVGESGPEKAQGWSTTITLPSGSFGYFNSYSSVSSQLADIDMPFLTNAYYYSVTNCGGGCVDGDKIATNHGAYGAIWLHNFDSTLGVWMPDGEILTLCAQHSTSNNVCDGSSSISATITALSEVWEDSEGYRYQVYGVLTSPYCTQRQAVAFKLYWKPKTKGYLKITKKYTSDSDDTESGRTFTAYKIGSDGKCGTSDDTKVDSCTTADGSNKSCTIGKNGSKGTLDYTSYCIWEKNDGNGGLFDQSFITSYGSHEVTGSDGYKYAKVTLSSSSDPDDNDVRYETATVTNKRRKYCYAARKTDVETNKPLKGSFTFTSNGQSKTLSTSNAIAVFGPFNYAEIYNYNNTQKISDDTIKVKVTETSSSSAINTDLNKKFWTTAQTTDVKKASIKEAAYSNGTWTCPAMTNLTTYTDMPNVRVYYCMKIDKKSRGLNEDIGGAAFTAKGKTSGKSFTSKQTSTGHYSIFVEDNNETFTISETTTPKGYSTLANFTMTPFALPSKNGNTLLTKAQAKAFCEGSSTKTAITATPTATPTATLKYEDKLVLNWFKTKENGTSYAGSAGAQFQVFKKNSSTALKFSATKTSYKDTNNVTKSCYVYNGGNNTTLTSDSNGEVCIIGLDKGTASQIYTVKETKALDYHTFGTYNTKNFTVSNTSTKFAAFSANNKFVNHKTEFEFTKSVSSGDTTVNGVNWNSITTNELKKLTFNITNTNGTALSFIKTSDGVYEYAGNTIDKPSGTPTTELKLDNNRKFKVYHLPVGTYYVKEKKVCCDTSCNSCTGSTECSGYYYPGYTNESSYKFTITQCSSSNATASSCTTHKAATQSLVNKPTEITFTKKDLYTYADPTKTVKFENNEEINAFDRIKFRLKDENGNYVKLLKVGNTGTCKTESSYAEYRYVADESLLTAAQKANLTYDLYTCGGHIRINHLCRGKKYTIEEYEVPANTVFTLPDAHITKDYLIPFTDNGKMCCTDKTVTTTTTQEINDLPTRIELDKKNNRTSTNIHESASGSSDRKQTATFEVYACTNMNAKCTKSSSTGHKIKFAPARVYGSETVYPALLDQSGSGLTALNLTTEGNKGKLVLEYLPANYRYVVVETNGPDGYYNVTGTLAETEIEYIPKNTTNAAANLKNIIDYPTMIKFKKDDIYKYYKASDKDKMNSDNGIFDTMTFVLRNKDGNIVKLKQVVPGEYRFLQDDGTSTGNTITELHTKNGEMLITNLYRNEKYYIEETKTDTLGNFILPKNITKPSGIPSGWNWAGHPFVQYDINQMLPSDTQNGTVPSESVTRLIENLPTRVVFEKRDKKTGELIDDTKNHDNNTTFDPYQGIKTTFNVYRCPKGTAHCRANTQGAELVYFENRAYVNNGSGKDLTSDITSVAPPVLTYKYSKLNSSSGKIKDLITDRGMLVLAYLPSEYSYSLYEKTAPNGYYQPSELEAYTDFTVLSETTNDGSDYVELTSKIENTPTEINFIKSDLYNYYENEDLASIKNETLKIFDSMSFVLKDKNGHILKLKCSKDGELVNNKNSEDKCDTGEYRYIPVDDNNVITNMHTQKGKIKVTHLYRGETYYIEEVDNDTEGDFVLPDYLNKDLNYGDQLPFDNQGHPVVKYILPNEDANNPASVTAEIKNVPSRVRFEKRDSKYNYLIPDETTTFKVYQCDKNTDCHPADYSTDEERKNAGITLINFTERTVISGDQEDDGVQVYKYKKLNAQGVTELHPDKGVLVLRYLPSDPSYKYVLLETVAPKNYTLPKGRDAETAFTVASNTANVTEVDVPNAPTSLLIRKYDDNGKLLKGAQFKVYEGLTCDKSLSAMNQPKKVLQLKTIRDGVYEARPPYDDGDYTIVQTCDDANGVCSNIPTDELTRLTYERDIFNQNLNNTYVDSYADFENMTTEDGNIVEIQEGEALVQYLEYNHCYIVEEIKAPEGHSLPKHAEDRFTMVTIEENEKYYVDTGKALINKPTPFTFYKFDEYNSLLDGAEFKLQKLDDNKKYNDVTVTEIEDKGLLFYKVDGDTDNKVIKTKNGSATVYYLTPGQYRILETSPAPGKELSKNPNIATFFVDEAGNVYGNSIIINKAITEKRETITESSAEFIIGIQTGQTVIRYGIIIGVLVALITGLMILRKKSK